MNEAELVFTHVLNCDRLSLYLNKNKNLDDAKSLALAEIFKRRITGEPVQYILGSTEFMGFDFKIDKRALIPRPETEILAQEALREAEIIAKPCILDLCTGSGCIAVSLAKLIPHSTVWATDISGRALSLAQENASLNKARVRFVRADLFKGIRKRFDLIVCNPPYIRSKQISSLGRELFFEPKAALDGGQDGLDFYRRIIGRAVSRLKDKGSLIFEVGIGQSNKVKAMLAKSGFSGIKVLKDYNHIGRVVTAKNKGS